MSESQELEEYRDANYERLRARGEALKLRISKLDDLAIAQRRDLATSEAARERAEGAISEAYRHLTHPAQVGAQGRVNALLTLERYFAGAVEPRPGGDPVVTEIPRGEVTEGDMARGCTPSPSAKPPGWTPAPSATSTDRSLDSPRRPRNASDVMHNEPLRVQHITSDAELAPIPVKEPR